MKIDLIIRLMDMGSVWDEVDEINVKNMKNALDVMMMMMMMVVVVDAKSMGDVCNAMVDVSKSDALNVVDGIGGFDARVDSNIEYVQRHDRVDVLRDVARQGGEAERQQAKRTQRHDRADVWHVEVVILPFSAFQASPAWGPQSF